MPDLCSNSVTFIFVLKCKGNVVKAIEEAVAAKFVYLELSDRSIAVRNGLVFDVDS
ncbi:MAG: hypothetical protein ABIP78_10035 [Pyrinomonadaceae bacterium]